MAETIGSRFPPHNTAARNVGLMFGDQFRTPFIRQSYDDLTATCFRFIGADDLFWLSDRFLFI